MADVGVQVLGYAAAAVSCVQLVPQVVRTVRLRATAGVSPLMWALLGAQSAAWIVFGASRHLWPAVSVNVVLIGCVTAMLTTLGRELAPGLGLAVRVMVGLLAVEAVLVATLPLAVLGGMAGLLAALVLWPQVLVALRSTDLSGLSRASWVLSAVTSVQWAAYGLATGTAVTWLSASHNLVLSLVVVGRLYLVDRRATARPELEAAAA